jgi:hypothetical protein
MDLNFAKTGVNYYSIVFMKIFFAIALVFFIYQLAHLPSSPKKISSPPSMFLAQDSIIDTVYFNDQIQPIFVRHCSPCHFPGGKMYARLPFDSAQTIINNSKGILRRIKDSTEKALIVEFVKRDH